MPSLDDEELPSAAGEEEEVEVKKVVAMEEVEVKKAVAMEEVEVKGVVASLRATEK